MYNNTIYVYNIIKGPLAAVATAAAVVIIMCIITIIIIVSTTAATQHALLFGVRTLTKQYYYTLATHNIYL